MRLGRRGITAALALLLAVPAVVVAGPAAASPGLSGAGAGGAGAVGAAAIRGGSVSWAACEEDPTADCGVLRVPIDWKKPRGPKFDLALARRKATDPAKRIGILVINPGGPGGSGVNAALGAAEVFTPEILAKFDVVGFDPRGVARSNPVVCSAELMAKAPSPVLTSQADFDRLIAYNAELGKDCRARTGPLFDHVDTGNVIQDIDALRIALGERKINYYGVSYGTLIGQQYAERYPKNFRALVIDSNMDHSLGTRDFLLTETANGEANFREFVKWCARDARCAVRDPGASQVWNEVIAKADRGELPHPEDPTRTLTSWDIRSAALDALYGPDWKWIADVLAALNSGTPLPAARTLLAGSARGAGEPANLRFAGTAARAGSERAGSVGAGVVRAGSERVGAERAGAVWAGAAAGRGALAGSVRGDAVPTGAVQGGAARAVAEPEVRRHPITVFCEDWRFQVRDYREAARLWAQADRLAPHMGMSPLAWGVGAACLGFGAPVNNPQHRLSVRGAAPILMTNPLYDPATAYVWATNAARQLGRAATLVTYEGWGHGVYGRGECSTAVTDRYLVDLTVPKRGTRCPAVPPVFEPGAKRATGQPSLPW